MALASAFREISARRPDSRPSRALAPALPAGASRPATDLLRPPSWTLKAIFRPDGGDGRHPKDRSRVATPNQELWEGTVRDLLELG